MNIRKLKIWFRRAVHAVKINKSIGRGNITLKKHHSYNKKSEAEETRWTEVFQRSRVAGGMWAPPERWRGRESARGEEAARPLPRRCFTCGETFQPQEASWPSQPVPRHLTPATRLAATASGRRVSALECSEGPLCWGPGGVPGLGTQGSLCAFPLAPLCQPALRRRPQGLGGDELTTCACHWWDV